MFLLLLIMIMMINLILVRGDQSDISGDHSSDQFDISDDQFDDSPLCTSEKCHFENSKNFDDASTWNSNNERPKRHPSKVQGRR